MEAILGANLALAFLLELCLLAALGYWGYRAGQSTLARWLLALGAPALMAVFWGVFLSPQADLALPDGLKLVLRVLAFAIGAAGLAAVGQRRLGLLFIVVVIINLGLALIWAQ